MLMNPADSGSVLAVYHFCRAIVGHCRVILHDGNHREVLYVMVAPSYTIMERLLKCPMSRPDPLEGEEFREICGKAFRIVLAALFVDQIFALILLSDDHIEYFAELVDFLFCVIEAETDPEGARDR